MDIAKIRQMSDRDMIKYITQLSSYRVCAKCGNIVSPFERFNINIGIYQQYGSQKVRKLCGLCKDCYTDLLDYLGVADIDWEDHL